MNLKKTIFFIALLAAALNVAAGRQLPVKQKNGQLYIGNKPYYYIGTNFWYGAILGSKAEGGNKQRLIKELDLMQAIGINNLRILIGADGPEGQAVKIMPTLQQSPGVYNDAVFDGLDFLLAEMEKRNMYAVLFFNNSWEWSGGYGQYLAWAGKGSVPQKGVADWPSFVQQVSKYANCDTCHTLFFNHIKHVLARKNRYTGEKYTEDATIMSWQVGNEPRAFSQEAKPAFANWLKNTTSLIRSLDKTHLISIGTEGIWGSENDENLFEQIHADKNVDYLTMHIWPKNWNWIDINNISATEPKAWQKTNEYLQQHIIIAKKLNKPIILEEFGLPRDHHLYTLTDSTTARDKYYTKIFEQIVNAKKQQNVFAGCNFWAWGGYGRAKNVFWKPWDDYLGDPSQEEQGLNSVFSTDTTIEIIKKYCWLLR